MPADHGSNHVVTLIGALAVALTGGVLAARENYGSARIDRADRDVGRARATGVFDVKQGRKRRIPVAIGTIPGLGFPSPRPSDDDDQGIAISPTSLVDDLLNDRLEVRSLLSR